MEANSPSIRLRFDTHGLGDCCHAATVLQLYLQRGYDVAIQVEANKRWMWQAADIPIYDGPGQLPLHPYHYPNEFFHLNEPDWIGSKIVHLISGVDERVLPRLASPEFLWHKICHTRVDVTPSISAVAHRRAEQFLSGLPKPIFAIHSRGTNWSEEKSIPDGVAFQTIKGLLDGTAGSVIVLDFDRRAPTLAGHQRCKTICADWPDIDLDGLAALYTRLDMLIGIDSGPFHFASMIPGLKMLGVFRKIPAVRCCIPNEQATYLVPGRDHLHWQRRLDTQASDIFAPVWNLVEYRAEEPTAHEIVELATDSLLPVMPRKSTNPTVLSEHVDLIPGSWLYRRMGYDERILELLPDGHIGLGGAGCERKWRVLQTGPVDTLAIYGDGNRETCKLISHGHGIYQGRWNEHEKMSINLIRQPDFCRGQDLWNGQQQIFTPKVAIDLFPGYDSEWDLPVGTRGNGAAWLLDERVVRYDMDGPGINSDRSMKPYVDHEDWIWQYLDVPAGSVCLDMASFIGTNSVWWARRGATVIAVEPMPRSRDLLLKNLALNQVTDRVTVFHKAFSNAPSVARMRSEQHSASAISDEGDVEVEVTTVDIELLPHLQRLDCIKLDVEGAEANILRGALETVQRFRPKIITEVHGHYSGCEKNIDIMAQLYEQLDYKWHVIWRNTWPGYCYTFAEWQG